MVTEPIVITEPGVYPCLPAEDYHAQTHALSSSGARKLLAPSCPALFRHEQLNPPGPKKVFEIGTAAHRIVFGDGPEIVQVDHPIWNTNAIKAEVSEIREAGKIPLKAAEYEQVHAMAEKLREDETAAALFNPLAGRAEQSLFWTDEPTGTLLRSRLDWLPFPTGRRMILGDYKTAAKVDFDSIEKAVNEHGYHQQDAWYRTAVQALGLADDVTFVFIFQMKDPPYLVTPVELRSVTVDVGHYLNRDAINLFAECTASGRWPGFTEGIAYLGLPPWAEARHIKEYA